MDDSTIAGARAVKERRGLDAILAAGAPACADAETALCVRIVNAVNLLAAFMHIAAFTTYAAVFERVSAEALAYACARLVCYAMAAAGYWKLARAWTLVITGVFFILVFQELSPGWGGEFLMAIMLAMPLSVFRRDERFQSWGVFALALALCGYAVLATQQNAAPFVDAHPLYWPVYYVTVGVAALALVGLIAILRMSLLKLYDQVESERGIADGLLRNILPAKVVEKMRGGQSRIAEGRAEATVIFLDIVGFTDLTRRLGPNHLIEVLDQIFSELDEAAERHGVEKVKTIGDAYMAATGITRDATPDDAAAAARFAIEANRVVSDAGAWIGRPLQARIGMHTGPVVAGVLGKAKAVFDIWGEAVNVAARLESTAEPGAILLSEQTYWRLRNQFTLKALGAIELKGQGPTEAFELIDPDGARERGSSSVDTLDAPNVVPMKREGA